MKIKELVQAWEQTAGGRIAARDYRLSLPVRDAARIAALAEMYPLRGESELIAELLSAALDELEAGMAYVAGPRVVAEDEEGNPVYEDIGPTPRFLALSRKHLQALEAQARQ